MFCRNCGNQVADGLKFCPTCGNPMEQAAAPVYEATPQYDGAVVQQKPALDDQKKKLIAVVAAALVVVILAIIFIPKVFGGKIRSAEDLAEKYIEAGILADADVYDLYMYDFYEYTERRWSKYAAEDGQSLEMYIQNMAFEEGYGKDITTVEEYYEAAADEEAEEIAERGGYDVDIETMLVKEYNKDENTVEYAEYIADIQMSKTEYGIDSMYSDIDIEEIEGFAEVSVHADVDGCYEYSRVAARILAVEYDGEWKFYKVLEINRY